GTRVIQLFEISEAGRTALAHEQRIAPKQRLVLETLAAATEPMRGEILAEAAGCGTGPIESVRKRGWVNVLRRRTDIFEPDLVPPEKSSDLTLNVDQHRALQSVLGSLRAGEHKTFLLHGVTGSGKTEVYIQAIREVV